MSKVCESPLGAAAYNYYSKEYYILYYSLANFRSFFIGSFFMSFSRSFICLARVCASLAFFLWPGMLSSSSLSLTRLLSLFPLSVGGVCMVRVWFSILIHFFFTFFDSLKCCILCHGRAHTHPHTYASHAIIPYLISLLNRAYGFCHNFWENFLRLLFAE